MKNFAMIGAAGYIAPRHMKAIKETGNNLIVALDKNDSVGIIDSFFPNADFFTEFERFDRHIEKLRRSVESKMIDYVTICSPNYLHDSHVRFALRVGAIPICEKPLVLNPWNLDGLEDIEKEYGNKINTILQLRLHPKIIELKESIDKSRVYDVELTTITCRGKWYNISWKGDIPKSGGITTNIGIHNFDMLIWLFGDVKDSKVYLLDNDKASGFLQLERANVKWYLSLDGKDLAKVGTNYNSPSFRSIKIDGEEVDFSSGFTDLHTKSYLEILEGRGFKISDVRRSIELSHNIRTSNISPVDDIFHHFLKH
ncbi:MAG: oxidoreductase [Candidatus Cloacimonadota bacterium]|nr:MAG: oxidoreductase [Candidatus Cloacimonadota bacterium]PIE77717.1 MAG: oxidoreductase [Candidatus Delongbacteria bacterium]